MTGDGGRLPLVVVAAHRTGQPLHPQLVELGGRYVRAAMTAPVYRLLALPAGDGVARGVARGGVVWAGADGARIEVEVHDLPRTAFGDLVESLPLPLAVGRVLLADGSCPVALVCTHAPVDAIDVTAHGSWPAFLASTTA